MTFNQIRTYVGSSEEKRNSVWVWIAVGAQSPRAAEWDALMREFQQPVPGASPSEWWAAMEEAFDLNG